MSEPAGTHGETPTGAHAFARFPVACLGASAGGVKALQEVLGAFTAQAPLAVVVLLHREAHRADHLLEVLGRAGPLPVHAASEGVHLEPGHVYVTPSDRHLDLREGVFTRDRVMEHGERGRCLDHLLTSLAAELGPRLMAVVLSGTGCDGAAGVTEVKARGGIVLAQDGSAAFDGMPRAAIATGHVDRTLPPADIASELERLAAHSYARTPAADGEDDADDGALLQALEVLRQAHGVDFDGYKRGTLRRRARRRAALHGCRDLAEYARLVADDPAEVDALYQDILIGVTLFFRDAPAFEALRRTVLPALLRERPGLPLRMWVPGCSTGEEVYSLAMALLDVLGPRSASTPVKVFGTDVSTLALERARAGLYPAALCAPIGAERLRRYFFEDAAGQRVQPWLRSLCVFARQDLTRDPPISNLDLISCRNVLIYFDAPLQRRVLPVLHHALRPGGFLLLGAAESVGPHGDLFEAVDEEHRIFRKRRAAARPLLQLPLAWTARPSGPADPREAGAARRLRAEAEHLLLERGRARAVVVDGALEVVHVVGDVDPFLRLGRGAPRLGLLELAREALRGPLRAALEEARTALAPARRRVDLGGLEAETATLEVAPLGVVERETGGFLVMFEAARRARAADSLVETVRGWLGRGPSRPTVGAAGADLRRELDDSRRSLRVLTEERHLRRLAAVVRDSNDAITLLDLAGHIVDWNRGAERMYGYSREEALRLTAADLAPPELRDEMRSFVLRQTAAPAESRSFETRRLTRDGRVLDVWLTTTVIVDPAGAVEGIATTERDITERRRAEEALREADRRKDEFISILGHELRNPLAAITYGLVALRKLVLERGATEGARDTIVRLEHQAEALSHLVDDLMDVSRIARGEMRLGAAPVDLVAVARHALDAAAPLLEARRQTAAASLPDAPAWVRGDEHRLEQVVYNLLHNASKFSPRGKRVWLAVEPSPQAVTLRVKDEGMGIEPERLAAVFAGAPAKDERVTRQRGLGLGLPLVKRLVELHGGRIEARSEGRDRGAELVVTLPRLEPGPEGRAGPKGRRVLLVEDEPDVALHLDALLRDRGHEVKVATDVATALKALDDFAADVVLSDLALGEDDGCALARTVRQRGGRSPLLIAVTGYGSDADRQRTRAAGFDHHLVKPLDLEALEQLLAQPARGGE